MRSHTVAKLKAYLAELQASRSSDHEIALGFTIGTFISILPTPGFNILLGALVMALYPRINKLAIFGAMAFYNPIVMIPFYWASYALGSAMFSAVPVVLYDVVILDQAYDFTRRYLVGNLIVAMTTTTLTYPIVHAIARRWRSHALVTPLAR
jgi:uncharacterized protein (DUF2062 family)